MLPTQGTLPHVPSVDTKKQSRQARPELVATAQGTCFKDLKEKPINKFNILP